MNTFQKYYHQINRVIFSGVLWDFFVTLSKTSKFIKSSFRKKARKCGLFYLLWQIFYYFSFIKQLFREDGTPFMLYTEVLDYISFSHKYTVFCIEKEKLFQTSWFNQSVADYFTATLWKGGSQNINLLIHLTKLKQFHNHMFKRAKCWLKYLTYFSLIMVNSSWYLFSKFSW